MTAFDKAWNVLKGANTWSSRHAHETPRVRARGRADFQEGMARHFGGPVQGLQPAAFKRIRDAQEAGEPTISEKLQQEIQRIESERGSFQDRQQERDLLQGNFGPTEQFPDREGPLERAALQNSRISQSS